MRTTGSCRLSVVVIGIICRLLIPLAKLSRSRKSAASLVSSPRAGRFEFVGLRNPLLTVNAAQEAFRHPVDSEIAVPHYIGWFRMQIRPLFLPVPRAPPPSSGVHCEPRLTRAHGEMPLSVVAYVHLTRTRERTSARYEYINNNIRGGSGIRYNYSPDAAR